MNDKKLTIEQANRIADGLVTVFTDDVDPDLWRVEGDGCVETHEPMTAADWQRFVDEWDTTDAEPADDAPAGNALADALRDALSPEAVATIACYARDVRTNDPNVNREVDWFADQLAEMLGGWPEQGRLMENLGL